MNKFIIFLYTESTQKCIAFIAIKGGNRYGLRSPYFACTLPKQLTEISAEIKTH